MKFALVDRILELERGRRVVAVKALSLAEEYLADHFPRFPVLPGVLMLEAMVQASAWLVRDALDFRPSLVVLREARNVTYKSFLAPGRVMRIESECRELGEEQSLFAASGSVDGREIVKARLVLAQRSLGAESAEMAAIDERVRGHQRRQFELLWSVTPAGAARQVDRL